MQSCIVSCIFLVFFFFLSWERQNTLNLYVHKVGQVPMSRVCGSTVPEMCRCSAMDVRSSFLRCPVPSGSIGVSARIDCLTSRQCDHSGALPLFAVNLQNDEI